MGGPDMAPHTPLTLGRASTYLTHYYPSAYSWDWLPAWCYSASLFFLPR